MASPAAIPSPTRSSCGRGSPPRTGPRRIDTVIGPHVVEVYDIVTETRRKFDIVVKDERLSVRVKIDN